MRSHGTGSHDENPTATATHLSFCRDRDNTHSRLAVGGIRRRRGVATYNQTICKAKPHERSRCSRRHGYRSTKFMHGHGSRSIAIAIAIAIAIDSDSAAPGCRIPSAPWDSLRHAQSTTASSPGVDPLDADAGVPSAWVITYRFRTFSCASTRTPGGGRSRSDSSAHSGT